MPGHIAVISAAVLIAGCAAASSRAPQAVRDAIAPTGTLRAGVNLQNNLFTVKDGAGELQGVAVDVLQELGRRLGAPVQYVMYETPGKVADDAPNAHWDAAVLAIEQTRAKVVAFSPPMTAIEATCLVPGGLRVTAIAALRPMLIENQAKVPGSRLLEGSFMAVNHGVAVPQGRPVAAGWVRGEVDDLNRSGFIARSLERHHVQGLSAVSR